MSDIVDDCFWEILSRLPVVPLLQFRCVCKAWRQIIDNPKFIKLQLQNQTEGHDQVLIRARFGKELYTMSLESLTDFDKPKKTIPAPPANTLTLCVTPALPLILTFSSCNGLILIPSYNEKTNWVLWNPCTGESREFPLFHREKLQHLSCGLGFDSAADDYKVVGVVGSRSSPQHETLETLVYSLKSNSWRKIMDFPVKVDWRVIMFSDAGWSNVGSYLDGALHWMSCNMQGERQIIVLDLETENYRILSLPSQLNRPLITSACLDVKEGCLFIKCYSAGACFEGWIMKDYGVSDSWKKLFSFRKPFEYGHCSSSTIVAYLKSKGLVLIREDGGKYFWVDVEKETERTVSIKSSGLYTLSTQVFRASLVRLYSNGGGVADCSGKNKLEAG